MTTEPALAEQIDALTAFLPQFEPARAVGQWEGGERDANGVTSMPWFDYSPEALAFFRTCAANGWIEPFAWPDFLDEAHRYFTNPALLDEADVPTIRKLLTLHVRRDRFHEGHFASVAESGHIAAILHRLQAIRSTLAHP